MSSFVARSLVRVAVRARTVVAPTVLAVARPTLFRALATAAAPSGGVQVR
jgi:hypothetical protein